MMKKFLIPVMAVAAVSVALPAAAQHQRGPGHDRPGYSQDRWGGPSMASRVRNLERNVEFAHRARVMSTGKAREFRRDIANLVNLEHRYGPRPSVNQRHDLERRYQNLDRAIDRYVQRARYRR